MYPTSHLEKLRHQSFPQQSLSIPPGTVSAYGWHAASAHFRSVWPPDWNSVPSVSRKSSRAVSEQARWVFSQHFQYQQDIWQQHVVFQQVPFALSALLFMLLLHLLQRFQIQDILQLSPYFITHVHCIVHIRIMGWWIMRISYSL